MANKGDRTEKKVSKSELIRSTKASHPDAGPTELSAILKSTYGVDVKPAMISTVLSQDRVRGDEPARRGRPPKDAAKKAEVAAMRPASTAGSIKIENLVQAKILAEKMGGIGEAKAALDALSKILS